MPVYSRNSIS